MSEQQMVWEEPPKIHQRSEWTDFLVALKAFPGKWAKVGDYPTGRKASGIASSMRNAADALGGGWEIKARTLPTGKGGVWAKYWVVATDEDDIEGALLPLAMSDIEDDYDRGLPGVTVHVERPDGTVEGPFPSEIGTIVSPVLLDDEGNVIATAPPAMVPYGAIGTRTRR